jgi:S-formylglutathione hydrolase FrmB
MRTSLLVLSIILLHPVARPQPAVTVRVDSLPSAATGGHRKYCVVLPEGYAGGVERYAVLYLLHGLNGNHRDWIERSRLTTHAGGMRLIVVTPDAGNSWYTNAPGDSTARFEDFIVRELIPVVEAKYRTLATRNGRFIAGLSMGGNGAVKIALKHPGLFAAAGSFSGAFQVPRMEEHLLGSLRPSVRIAYGPTDGPHWTANDVSRLIDSAETASLPSFSITVGRNDALPGLLAANRVVAAQLQQRKIDYEYHETAGGHDWRTWDRALGEFLQSVRQMMEERP